MTPETGFFLAKARKLLAEADKLLAIDLYDAAGRAAYLAAFHAAQAFISEKTGRSVKSHKGVHGELYRLTRNAPGFDANLTGFLSRAYDLKATADYETGPDADVSEQEATEAVNLARRFVAWFDTALGEPPQTTADWHGRT